MLGSNLARSLRARFGPRARVENPGPARSHCHRRGRRRDEALQVNAENGQPLLHIARNQQGPVIRLLQADTQVELPGKLRIAAGEIELCARKGAVRIDASDDVEIVGEAIHLN